MASLLTNAAGPLGKVSRRTVGGREYFVAPASLIPGNGILPGSKGSLFYPEAEVARNAAAWDRIPIVAYHPQDPLTGEHISAKDDGVWDKQGLGFLHNSGYKDGKLRTETWFDVQKTRDVDPRIYHALMNNQPLELSTGLYTTNEPAAAGTTHNGRPYEAVARDYRPDHLAILPDQKGACGVRDGCGVLVNQETLIPTVNPFVSEEQRKACYAKDDPDWDCEEFDKREKKTTTNSEDWIYPDFTANSNPEGINQYTNKSAAAHKESADAHEGSEKAWQLSGKAKTAAEHMVAAKAHSFASSAHEDARETHREALKSSTSRVQAKMHEAVGDVHKEASAEHHEHSDFHRDKAAKLRGEASTNHPTREKATVNEANFFSRFWNWITNAQPPKALGKETQPRHTDSGQYLPHGGKAAVKQTHAAAVKGSKHTESATPPLPVQPNTADDAGRQKAAVTPEIGPELGGEADDHDNPSGSPTNLKKAAPPMATVVNKEFTSMDEQRAAFAAMDSDNGSKGAREASDRAESKGTASAHKAAAAAHKEASEYHKDSGNEQHAAAHDKAAAYHSKQARSAKPTGNTTMTREQAIAKLTANCGCDADRAALNMLSDATLLTFATNAPIPPQFLKKKKGEEDDEDDVDNSKPATNDTDSPAFDRGGKGSATQAGGKGTKEEYAVNSRGPTMQEWLASAPPEAQAVWNHAVSIEHREREALVNRLVSHVTDTALKGRLTANHMKKNLSTLRDEVAALPPVYNQQQSNGQPVNGPDFYAPMYIGGAATQQVNNTEEDLLDTPTLSFDRKTA